VRQTRRLPSIPGSPRQPRQEQDQHLDELSENIESGTTVEPFLSHEGAPFADFVLLQLDEATTYDRSYPNRKVAYYGEHPYKYPGGFHKARPLAENSYLTGITTMIRELFPTFDFNSVMVTKYASRGSNIPPHSDDEPCIAQGSNIVTVSLGQTRHVAFRRKPPGQFKTDRLEVKHGEVYTMTRHSQDYWDHAVPRLDNTLEPETRISITYRMITSSSNSRQHTDETGRRNSATDRRPQPQRAAPPQRPKKVLILSDSKNADFDCSLLQDPVVAFREPLFYLRDLDKHSVAINQGDVVLISAGLNDIRFGRADPWTLHNHLRHVARRFPRTQFLFDSISPLTMTADPYNKVNRDINATNELVLKLSLRTANFKLFDNLKFGLPHLSRDGTHFNGLGKSLLSECWVWCILKALGRKDGPLPLRVMFSNIASDFDAALRSRG
jgi:alkylated DNA repair dioxygenase AlkB